MEMGIIIEIQITLLLFLLYNPWYRLQGKKKKDDQKHLSFQCTVHYKNVYAHTNLKLILSLCFPLLHNFLQILNQAAI